MAASRERISLATTMGLCIALAAFPRTTAYRSISLTVDDRTLSLHEDKDWRADIAAHVDSATPGLSGEERENRIRTIEIAVEDALRKDGLSSGNNHPDHDDNLLASFPVRTRDLNESPAVDVWDMERLPVSFKMVRRSSYSSQKPRPMDSRIVRVLYVGAFNSFNVGDDLLKTVSTKLVMDTFATAGFVVQIDYIRPTYPECLKAPGREYDFEIIGPGTLLNSHYLCCLDRPYFKYRSRRVLFGTGATDLKWLQSDVRDSIFAGNFEHAWNLYLESDPSGAHRLATETINDTGILGGVRGPFSKMFLEKSFSSNKTLDVPILKDPGLLTPDYFPVVKKRALFDFLEFPGVKKYLSFNFGAWFGDEGAESIPYYFVIYWRLAQKVLKETQYNIVFYIMDVKSVKPYNNFMEFFYIKAQDTSLDLRRVRFIRQPIETPLILGIIRYSVVTMNFKLHASVLAASLGVPFVSFAYCFKHYDFADSIGMMKYVLHLSASSNDEVDQNAWLLLKSSLDNRKNISNQLKEHVAKTRKDYDDLMQSLIREYNGESVLKREDAMTFLGEFINTYSSRGFLAYGSQTVLQHYMSKGARDQGVSISLVSSYPTYCKTSQVDSRPADFFVISPQMAMNYVSPIHCRLHAYGLEELPLFLMGAGVGGALQLGDKSGEMYKHLLPDYDYVGKKDDVLQFFFLKEYIQHGRNGSAVQDHIFGGLRSQLSHDILSADLGNLPALTPEMKEASQMFATFVDTNVLLADVYRKPLSVKVGLGIPTSFSEYVLVVLHSPGYLRSSLVDNGDTVTMVSPGSDEIFANLQIEIVAGLARYFNVICAVENAESGKYYFGEIAFEEKVGKALDEAFSESINRLNNPGAAERHARDRVHTIPKPLSDNELMELIRGAQAGVSLMCPLLAAGSGLGVPFVPIIHSIECFEIASNLGYLDYAILADDLLFHEDRGSVLLKSIARLMSDRNVLVSRWQPVIRQARSRMETHVKGLIDLLISRRTGVERHKNPGE